jgi:putative Holliday junction resolvase
MSMRSQNKLSSDSTDTIMVVAVSLQTGAAERPGGRLLGLDIGLRRIGIAFYDPAEGMVRGLDTLQRKRREEDLARLSRMAAERRATAFVSGLPLNMDGEFCGRLERASGLTVHFQDERLTSVEAEGRMKDAGWSLKKLLAEKRKGAVDRLAAVLVLEDYVAAQASREGAK